MPASQACPSQACSDPTAATRSGRGRHRAPTTRTTLGRLSARAALTATVTGTVALTGLTAPAWANDQLADSTAGATIQPGSGDVSQAPALTSPSMWTPTGATPSEPEWAGSTPPASDPAGSSSAGPAAPASGPGAQPVTLSASAGSLGQKIVYLASKQAGKPYLWGATGPNAFDCSGLVQYIYKQLGRNVPRVTDAQYAASQKVPQSAKQPGDLIFFGSPGNIYHVGIYAGNDMMWAAPHSGTVVRLQKIYSSRYLVGRIQ